MSELRGLFEVTKPLYLYTYGIDTLTHTLPPTNTIVATRKPLDVNELTSLMQTYTYIPASV